MQGKEFGLSHLRQLKPMQPVCIACPGFGGHDQEKKGEGRHGWNGRMLLTRKKGLFFGGKLLATTEILRYGCAYAQLAYKNTLLDRYGFTEQ